MAMEKMTPEQGSSLDIVSENLQALKAILPEAFTEDGVDFDVQQHGIAHVRSL